jgi:aminoglycoside 3-N-acetyltransferase
MMTAAARDRLAAALLAAGLRPGGTALVHSSLSSLGYLPGGAETVVRGLLEALGAEGTLLVPALSYAHVHPGQPVFDARRTPANIGAVPEHFRTRRGSRRSLHPTHSVCGIGPQAEWILAEHHLDRTPCGPHSPFRRLFLAGGQVVFLGCGMRPNTSMHGVEERVEPPYLFAGTTVYRLIREDGGRLEMACRGHDFKGWAQRYERIAPLLSGDELRTGRALQATVHILEARAMWERGEAALRRDPFFFVERLEEAGRR